MNALLCGGPHNNKEMTVEDNSKSIVFPVMPQPTECPHKMSAMDIENCKSVHVVVEWYERGPITKIDGKPIALFNYKGQR